MTEKLEDNLMSVIKSYGIDVNRAELLKALNYDRDQYEKGYRCTDGCSQKSSLSSIL